MLPRLAIVAVGLLVGSAVATQEKPNFSGKWVLVSPAERPSSVASEIEVSQWVEQSSVSPFTGRSIPFEFITIERRLADGVRSERYQIGLGGGIVAGLNPQQRPGQPPQTKYQTGWTGARLKIETARYSGWDRNAGPWTERMEEWSLDPEGKLVIDLVERSSEAAETTMQLIYRRP